MASRPSWTSGWLILSRSASGFRFDQGARRLGCPQIIGSPLHMSTRGRQPTQVTPGLETSVSPRQIEQSARRTSCWAMFGPKPLPAGRPWDRMPILEISAVPSRPRTCYGLYWEGESSPDTNGGCHDGESVRQSDTSSSGGELGVLECLLCVVVQHSTTRFGGSTW